MEQVKQIGTYLSQLYKVGWGLRGSLLGKGTFLLTQHLQAGQLVYVDNFFGDFHNNSALNLDNHEMTAVLLAREDLTRATINLRNHMGRSPVISAIHDNSVACLILLPNVDLDMREEHQRSPLSSDCLENVKICGESQYIVDQM